MATHVVSWGGSEHIVSPSTPSIVSMDSISSAVQKAAHSNRYPESWVTRTNSLTKPNGSETSISSTYPGADATGDGSFIRHHKYFFKDGNLTFLIEGTLYCVHRYFFSRDSVYFSTRFDQLSIRDHEALPTIISPCNIERKDFDAFLSILYPENFEQHNLSYEEWKSVLHLSTRWDFASIRRLALNNIQPPTPHDRLLLARTYSVDHWVIPALSALCERRAPLSLDEARQMDIEDVVLVATVREDIRDHVLQVHAAEIPRRVEAAQAGKLVRIGSVDISPAIRMNEAIERTSSLMGQKRTSKGCESDGEASVSPAALNLELVWIDEIDKGFQGKKEAQEDIAVRKERLRPRMEDAQRMVRDVEHTAEAARLVKLKIVVAEEKAKYEANKKAMYEAYERARYEADKRAGYEAKEKEAEEKAKCEAELLPMERDMAAGGAQKPKLNLAKR